MKWNDLKKGDMVRVTSGGNTLGGTGPENVNGQKCEVKHVERTDRDGFPVQVAPDKGNRWPWVSSDSTFQVIQ